MVQWKGSEHGLESWALGDGSTFLLDPQFLHVRFSILRTWRYFKSCKSLSRGGLPYSVWAQTSVHKAGERWGGALG